ncbi:RabGAP TBC domain-containing protein, partial [Musa troglodytarum]
GDTSNVTADKGSATTRPRCTGTHREKGAVSGGRRAAAMKGKSRPPIPTVELKSSDGGPQLVPWAIALDSSS